jgi:hypothetical protein
MTKTLLRLMLALIGGFAITVSLLLGMTEISESLRLRDPTKYFRISDITILPSGRWRPSRPATPELPPARTAPELGSATPQSLDADTPDRPAAPAPGTAPLDIPPELREGQ